MTDATELDDGDAASAADIASCYQLRCDKCGTLEHINLIDAKPPPGADREDADFTWMECIACYGPGWCPAGGPDDIKLSIAPGLRWHYRRWRWNEFIATPTGHRLVSTASSTVRLVLGVAAGKAMLWAGFDAIDAVVLAVTTTIVLGWLTSNIES